MADNKTSKPEEEKKAPKKAPKKKSEKKNPFKTIVKFFKGVNAERKKVIWPTAKETLRNTVIVLVVVVIVGVAIYIVDTGLSLGMKGLRGLKDKAEVTTETTTASAEDALNELLDGSAAEDAAAEDSAEQNDASAEDGAEQTDADSSADEAAETDEAE